MWSAVTPKSPYLNFNATDEPVVLSSGTQEILELSEEGWGVQLSPKHPLWTCEFANSHPIHFPPLHTPQMAAYSVLIGSYKVQYVLVQ
jgi:hypothetical protein